ncbi:hypothetical protein GCM10028805_17620 [Spirosoma harenae]
MAHMEKKNKTVKKVATKAPKVHGAPKVPQYQKNESGFGSLILAPKPKK